MNLSAKLNIPERFIDKADVINVFCKNRRDFGLSMNNKNIAIGGIISRIFDEEIERDMYQWYEDTVSGKWDYVVFVVRRSYILAQLLEKATGHYMSDVENTVYLTDASMFLCCSEFAEYYRMNDRFPKILLCDDLFIHGRNFNHILETMEERLEELLWDVEVNVLKQEFSRAVSVYVLIRTDAGSYLINRYGANFNYVRYEKAEKWHKLSSDFLSLVLESDNVSAAYIYSQFLEKTFTEKKILNDNNFIKTSYQGEREYIKVYLSKDNNAIKCVPTLRIVKNKETDGYRAIPFVFFANYDKTTTDRLYSIVLKKIADEYGEKHIRYIKSLYGLNKNRSFSEFFTFIFSNTLLHQLNMDYKINQDDDMAKVDYEIEKLVRNYYQGDMPELKKIIKDFVMNPLFKTVQELCDFFETNLSDEYVFIKFHQIDDNPDEKMIKTCLEDKFYKSGWDEEREACTFLENRFYSSENRFQRNTDDCAKVIGDIIDELNLGLNGIKVFFAFFMQMMDAGILSISSNAGKNCEVFGLAQFVKTGEQALLIKPLRFYKYLPMLNEVKEFCELHRIETEDVLKKIIQSDFENYTAEDSQGVTEKELADFLKELDDINQEPKDWLNNYSSRLEKTESKNLMEQISSLIKYLDERNDMKERAKEVLKTLAV